MTAKPKLQREPTGRRRTPQQALDDLKQLHKEILDRRHGVPIDVDAILDEMRGHTD